MRDTPKLVVFQTDNEPQWGGFSADYYSSYAIEGLIRSPLAWVKQRTGWQLADKQQLAYKFVHGSFFEANAESTYILLFAGVRGFDSQGFSGQSAGRHPQAPTRISWREWMTLIHRSKIRLASSLSIKKTSRYAIVVALGFSLVMKRSARRRNSISSTLQHSNKLAHANINRPTPDQLEAVFRSCAAIC